MSHFLIMAGGTAGHINPALAVATELRQRNHQVTWLGSLGGMEQELVAREGLTIELLPIKGLRGKGLLELVKAPIRLISSVFLARKVIKRHSIDACVGFGGFASGPGGIASVLSKRPLLIHEQNAIAGLTNRVLAKFAQIVCEAFANSFKPMSKLKTTGNPLRSAIQPVAAKQNNGNTIKILVVGGSRGALVLNQSFPRLFAPLLNQKKVNVWHQTGKQNSDAVKQSYKTLCADVNESALKVDEYIFNMHEAYQWADLVVCRAGALTVSEIMTVKVPAVFVPYPYAVDDHQTANAMVLVNKQCAEVIDQKEIDSVPSVVSKFLQEPNKLKTMKENFNQFESHNSTQMVADLCEQLLKGASQ